MAVLAVVEEQVRAIAVAEELRAWDHPRRLRQHEVAALATLGVA